MRNRILTGSRWLLFCWNGAALLVICRGNTKSYSIGYNSEAERMLKELSSGYNWSAIFVQVLSVGLISLGIWMFCWFVVPQQVGAARDD